MKVVNVTDEHSVMKFQRQADQLQKEGNGPHMYSNPEDMDSVTVTAKGTVNGPYNENDRVGESNHLEAIGQLGDQIKEYSITASQSHSEVDPRMVLSLFRE